MRKYRRHVSLFVWSDVSGAWKVKSVSEKAVHFLIIHLQEVNKFMSEIFNLVLFSLNVVTCILLFVWLSSPLFNILPFQSINLRSSEIIKFL